MATDEEALDVALANLLARMVLTGPVVDKDIVLPEIETVKALVRGTMNPREYMNVHMNLMMIEIATALRELGWGEDGRPK